MEEIEDIPTCARCRILLEEVQEQARLLGKSGSREAALLGKISRFEKALTAIASCKSNVPGDVVSVAQEALKG